MQNQHLISYSFRVDRRLMLAATLAAAANDQKMAQVIRNALRSYINGQPQEPAPPV